MNVNDFIGWFFIYFLIAGAFAGLIEAIISEQKEHPNQTTLIAVLWPATVPMLMGAVAAMAILATLRAIFSRRK